MSLWTRLWQRLGFKDRSHQEQPWPTVDDDGLLSNPANLPNETEEHPERPTGPLSRWAKRDQSLAQLQEGYERVTKVIDEIQKHLATQGERTERICGALEQLAHSMSDLPSHARQQLETLQTMAGQLEAANTHSQRLTDAVSEIPKSARAQSETLNGIRRQMEMSGEQAVMTSQNLDKLGSAVQALGQADATQGEMLRQMQSVAEQQGTQLNAIIERQARRFVMLFAVTCILAAAAIIAMFVRH